jgi:hypothetical protein
MHFITESDLKFQYSKTPFQKYQLAKNDRLTPEARQFLSDRLVKVTADSDSLQPKFGGAKLEKAVPTPEREATPFVVTQTWLFKVLAIDLMDAGIEGMKINPSVSQDLLFLKEYVLALAEKRELPDLRSIGDCKAHAAADTELDMIHILSEQGPLLLKLTRVNADIEAVRGVEPENTEILKVQNYVTTLICHLKEGRT